MCNITENFMEDELYFQQLKQEYEYRLWEQFITEEQEKQKAYDIMAELQAKEVEQYETIMMEKEYRELVEWDLLNN
jgi:hypothetical protein